MSTRCPISLLSTLIVSLGQSASKHCPSALLLFAKWWQPLYYWTLGILQNPAHYCWTKDQCGTDENTPSEHTRKIPIQERSLKVLIPVLRTLLWVYVWGMFFQLPLRSLDTCSWKCLYGHKLILGCVTVFPVCVCAYCFCLLTNKIPRFDNLYTPWLSSWMDIEHWLTVKWDDWIKPFRELKCALNLPNTRELLSSKDWKNLTSSSA